MVEQEELTVDVGQESKAVEFPAGLIGMEEWTRFELISHPAGGDLRLLQSVDDTRFSLILISPQQVEAEYRVNLTPAEAEALQLAGGAGAAPDDDPTLSTYCILSIQEEPLVITANLLGPVVINWQNGLGIQTILSDSSYSARRILVDESSAGSKPTGEA